MHDRNDDLIFIISSDLCPKTKIKLYYGMKSPRLVFPQVKVITIQIIVLNMLIFLNVNN